VDNDLVVAIGFGKPIDPADINRDMKYVIKKNNLPLISFHDLRHTHATTLLLLGENPKVASERLGHANAGITLIHIAIYSLIRKKILLKNLI
jgi:integrase